MKLMDCITFVDGIEPNAYTEAQKARWVLGLEARIYTELFLMQPGEFRVNMEYVNSLWGSEQDYTLTLPVPHDQAYIAYLHAMIHYANGEYDRYANSMALFNEAWHRLCVWFGQDYDVSDRARCLRVEAVIDPYVEDSGGDVRSRSIETHAYAVLEIPERCALVGGHFVVRGRSYVGASMMLQAYTRYIPEMEYAYMSAAGSYTIPMIIAPSGGDRLFVNVGFEIINPAQSVGQRRTMSYEDYIAEFGQQLIFTGRLLTPEEQFYRWPKIQVEPVEVDLNQVS